MVDYKYSELYKQESVDKQLNIAFDSGNIANEEIHSEQFELTESLCSDAQLRFGSCEASMIKFRISNIFTPLKDKWLTVTETLNHNTDTPFKFGKYKVYSDTPTADRNYRDVIAYDSMYDIINTDVAAWYNGLTFPVTQKEFRDSFFEFFGIEQEEIDLVNDEMIVEKTVEPSVLSGKDVITSICELNGCFGNIGRNGKFRYVFLPKYSQSLYPSDSLFPAEDLYPASSSARTIAKSLYIDCEYEDYVTQGITKLQIRQEENDIGSIVGSGDNCYIIEDNFLVYGKSTDDLESIANNILSVIQGTEYRPFKANVLGNPCFEVGDAVRFNTKYEIVESYILNRTLAGIQSLRDEYSAEGEEYYEEKVNDIQTQITQIKGKTNVLERTVDETRSLITDVENDLQSTIEQTAESIRLEVADETNELSSEIEQIAGQIVLSVNSKGKIVQVELSADPDSGSVFSVSADNIDLSAEEVISLMAGGTINLTGKAIEISSTNFCVDSDGSIKCSNADVSGDVDATTLNVKDKITMHSKQITGSIDEQIDAIWTSWELDSEQNYYQALYSAIEFFTKRVVTPKISTNDFLCDGDGYIGGTLITVGNAWFNSYLYSNIIQSTYATGATTTANPNCYISTEGIIAKTSTTSSKRFKDDVTSELCEALQPSKLYDVNVVQFKYKKDYFTNAEDVRYRKDLIGFIAEDIYEKYPICADYHMENDEVIVDGWNQQYMIPAMLKLIQEQHKEIETLKSEMVEVKNTLSFLMQKIGGGADE